MEITKLRELAKEAKSHPHYQFKHFTPEELQAAATASFVRLTPNQQAAVKKSWTKALTAAKEEHTVERLLQLLEYRFLCQTNLYFLCHTLEYSEMTIGTHEEICNEFFPQKDPRFKTFKHFATQYTDLKERMLLVPRGGFKSTMSMADCIQWIINYPEITILILTGVYKLAGDMLGEIKQHFTLEENGDKDAKSGKSGLGPRMMKDEATGEWSPSLLQILFPEHCVSPKEGSQFEYQTPAANVSKEPTVRAASIEQALSGIHIGILKLDDVVTNENSLNIDRIKSVNKQISINQAMLDPIGFFEVIGTWYDMKDYYGEKIKQEELFAKENNLQHAIVGSVDSGRFNSSVEMKIYLRAAWWPTDEAKKIGKIPGEMTKKDWVLWFDTPARLNYEFLLKKQRTDPEGFPIKYLNNPRELHKVKFPRELLVRRTIPHNQIPSQGVIVTAVDTAYSTGSWADFTVILTALIFAGRFHIVNMVRGRFNEFELPQIIAATANKWKPKRIAIEDSVGVKWMGRELRREMDKLQISVPVEFCSLGQGSKSNSKKMKAKPVLRLLGDERMFFSLACEGLQEIYAELEKFTGTTDDVHDDIVSAISLLVEIFGGYADNDRRINHITSDYVNDQKSKARYDQVFNNSPQAPARIAQSYADWYGKDDNPVTTFQIENTTGVAVNNTGDFDPLGDLF